MTTPLDMLIIWILKVTLVVVSVQQQYYELDT